MSPSDSTRRRARWGSRQSWIGRRVFACCRMVECDESWARWRPLHGLILLIFLRRCIRSAFPGSRRLDRAALRHERACRTGVRRKCSRSHPECRRLASRQLTIGRDGWSRAMRGSGRSLRQDLAGTEDIVRSTLRVVARDLRRLVFGGIATQRKGNGIGVDDRHVRLGWNVTGLTLIGGSLSGFEIFGDGLPRIVE